MSVSHRSNRKAAAQLVGSVTPAAPETAIENTGRPMAEARTHAASDQPTREPAACGTNGSFVPGTTRPAPGEPRPVDFRLDNPPFAAEPAAVLAERASQLPVGDATADPAAARVWPWAERRADVAIRAASREEFDKLRSDVADLNAAISHMAETTRAAAIRIAELQSVLTATNERITSSELRLDTVDGIITDAVVGLADSISRQKATHERQIQSLLDEIRTLVRNQRSETAAAIAEAAEVLRQEQVAIVAEAVEAMSPREASTGEVSTEQASTAP